MNNKKCFIICWFGKLPSYLPIWVKSCSYNPEYDFLIFSDSSIKFELPPNVKLIPFSLDEFRKRFYNAHEFMPSIKKAYRICDFRPAYGVIFFEELKDYDYWGYCDIDIVFGNIASFLSDDRLYDFEAVFNAGHFTLVKNNAKMNHLYKKSGSLFDYKFVMMHDGIFAFDETTGIKRIAKENGINALYSIPYFETEIKYHQLRSRLDDVNPDRQCFYWEKGELYRVKCENGLQYQKYCYIHLQKRNIKILDNYDEYEDSFWITPDGFIRKNYYGFCKVEDIDKYNTFEGLDELKRQEVQYRKKKIIDILKRNFLQVFIRIKQGLNGINSGDGSRREMKWEKP